MAGRAEWYDAFRCACEVPHATIAKRDPAATAYCPATALALLAAAGSRLAS